MWLMPINKNIWTPSFTVFTAGMAMLTLGAVFWLVDVLGYRRWAFPFVVYGMNAIAAFVAAGMVFRIARMFRVTDRVTGGSVDPYNLMHDVVSRAIQSTANGLHLPGLYTPGNTSLAGAIVYVLMIWLLMLVLYLAKIFVKISVYPVVTTVWLSSVLEVHVNVPPKQNAAVRTTRIKCLSFMAISSR